MSRPHQTIRIALSFAAVASLVLTSLVVGPKVAVAESESAPKRCSSMSRSIYQSNNPATGASLMTIWAREAATAKTKYGFTQPKRLPVRVSRDVRPGLTAVHRLYNNTSHDFVWTTSAREVTSAERRYGYVDKGVDFYASRSAGSCLLPVRRYIKHNVHRFAVTPAEQSALLGAGWRYETVAFYATGVTQDQEPASDTVAGKGPLARNFYLNKGTSAWSAYERETNGADKRLLYQIAATPTSIWLGGASGDGAYVDAITTRAASLHETPQFVLYAIPYRDCGKFWSGGLGSAAAYKRWIDAVRKGINGRNAVVIVEPDAIGMSCLSKAHQTERNDMLRYATRTLSTQNTWVYIHAGSDYLDPAGAADAVTKAGVQYARGIAVNVSSFDATASEIAYGKAVIADLGGDKHMVIDTSRNGLGRYTGWNGGQSASCNPPGRALGTRPTSKTGDPAVDAYLWIKLPGDSDGACHPGDPRHWFPSYALGLAQRALDHGTIRALQLPG